MLGFKIGKRTDSVCVRCETALTDNAKFCPKCGQKRLPLCPLCRHANESNDVYCKSCGALLNASKKLS